ncbi:hypothetical protein ACI2KR_09380 [Pseudomonas luteola]
MALGQFEFVGIKKNGTVGKLVLEGSSDKALRSEAKKQFKTITQVRRLKDVVNGSAEQASA